MSENAKVLRIIALRRGGRKRGGVVTFPAGPGGQGTYLPSAYEIPYEAGLGIGIQGNLAEAGGTYLPYVTTPPLS